MPSIPKKEGEIYHIVALDWYNKWKKYTGYNKVKLDDHETPDETLQSTAAIDENDDTYEDMKKLHIHNETPESDNKGHPGPINESDGF